MDHAEITKLADLEADHWWYGARRSMLKRAVSHLPVGVAVDVGAGAGGNTAVLMDRGWNATAVELSPTGATRARQRGIATARANATRLPFEDEQFDLVVSMDLWEHIEDDAAAAGEAFRILKHGGFLYLAVPSGMDLWSSHDVAVGHVRRYSRENLVRLVEGAGFDIRKLESWNVLLRPVVRWRRRGSGDPESHLVSDLGRVPRPLNTALRCVVELERLLPLKRRPGVTLVLHAYKP